MNRRLQEYCQEMTCKSSTNSTGDRCAAGEICGKVVRVKTECDEMFDGEDTGRVYQILQCGHTRFVEKEESIQHFSRNKMWDRMLPFQQEAVEFAENANLRILCGDEMGLGKTVIAANILRENAARMTDNFTKFCLVLVPTGGIYQWHEELTKWLDLENPQSMEHLMLAPQIILSMGQTITPMSKVIIIPWSKLSDKKFHKQVKGKVASFIVDECHFYKDENSQRTKAFLELSKDAGLNAPKVFLSGTSVENRVMELKVVLNQLDPLYFSSWRDLARMCTISHNGKILSISPFWRNEFFDITRKYIIARKKSDVNIPLPAIEYKKVWLNPSEHEANKELVEAYNISLAELESMLQSNMDAGSIIGLMQQLRHHTGRMKILSAAIWIDGWMTCNPGEKLCVGIHHKGVREALAKLLAHRKPLQMSDEDPKIKDEIERKFKSNGSNLLIASIISAGTGRNFQFCKNAIILERQWNRSKEDQFAQRFWRIIADEHGRIQTEFSEKDTVTIYTMDARNSFDEFFDEMIHLKGIIVDSTDDSVDDIPEESFTLELAKRVVQKRMKWIGA
jgi:SNF2 family DNA or RNA helicase